MLNERLIVETGWVHLLDDDGLDKEPAPADMTTQP